MLKVGLVGYGAFGQLIARHLKPYAEFTIYDRRYNYDAVEDVLAQPVIILAIPAQRIASFLETHQARLNPDGLYLDVCSVKVRPVHDMERLLPSTADIIATHPLFGPASAPQSPAGKKIMVHPVRVTPDKYKQFLVFLDRLRLIVIEATPEEHDRSMAYVQGLSHYIGRIMQQMNIPKTPFSTRAYDDLYDMKLVQGNDSDELFDSILHENAYTPEVLALFERVRREVDAKFKL